MLTSFLLPSRWYAMPNKIFKDTQQLGGRVNGRHQFTMHLVIQLGCWLTAEIDQSSLCLCPSQDKTELDLE